ncbi:MAG: hypothetical protein CML40_08410 [Rhodobacteraceae bacterium]|nr:MAG: hypothetical protein CML40_08410 [Paracoccaceae bacterium]
MTTAIENTKSIPTSIVTILVIVFLGLGIVYVAGHAQSSTLHDAAHDARHATGFPCH